MVTNYSKFSYFRNITCAVAKLLWNFFRGNSRVVVMGNLLTAILQFIQFFFFWGTSFSRKLYLKTWTICIFWKKSKKKKMFIQTDDDCIIRSVCYFFIVIFCSWQCQFMPHITLPLRGAKRLQIQYNCPKGAPSLSISECPPYKKSEYIFIYFFEGLYLLKLR